MAPRPDLKVTVLLSSSLRQEFRSASNIEFEKLEVAPARRFWFEQFKLPEMIRRSGADVLLSAGNFAIRKSPVPQILLSRNSIYTSADYYRDLRSRGEYRLWLDTHFRAVMAKRSILWADATVAPSEAFALELRRWTGRHVQAIHHGFDQLAFVGDDSPLAPAVVEKLRLTEGTLKLLFVSHYNYYRNFETLIRALPVIRECMGGRPVKLMLTCSFAGGGNPGAYRGEAAAELVKKLNVSEMLVELGEIPYRQLHHIYRHADIYVSPAYTETFAHPLVEAMASGLPVVASDLPVHQEICADAAVYFPPCSEQRLAEEVVRIAQSTDQSKRMASAGLERSRNFSWGKHVDQILALARTLASSGHAKR
jgi:glycosyltransferase involved in cell wall biosynthesis